MTPSERLPVERVVSEHDLAGLTAAEIDAVLELGYLAIACDRDVRDDELEGLGHVILRLDSAQADARGFGRLTEAVERFAAYLERDGIEGRLESCAAALSREVARDLAYKVARALSLADRDIGDREFELDLSLIAALGLTQDQADALADEVHASLPMT